MAFYRDEKYCIIRKRVKCRSDIQQQWWRMKIILEHSQGSKLLRDLCLMMKKYVYGTLNPSVFRTEFINNNDTQPLSDAYPRTYNAILFKQRFYYKNISRRYAPINRYLATADLASLSLLIVTSRGGLTIAIYDGSISSITNASMYHTMYTFIYRIFLHNVFKQYFHTPV